jgi:hypothetical protein
MKKLILILSVCYLLFSCEAYVTEKKNVTLSGKYVVSKLDITKVDQNETRDSLYLVGTTYNNSALPKPFNVISINHFYIHMDYSSIRMNLIGVTQGRDIWQYGSSPPHTTIPQNNNDIFYSVFGGTPYHSGYLQYNYTTIDGENRLITFLIEDDGIESLQLKSSGGWFNGKYGEKQVMTMFLTRVGP